MMSMNLSDIAILNIKGSDYRSIICLISKKWGHRRNAKCWFDWKKRIIIKHKNLFSHIKMDKEILAFDNIEIETDKFCLNKNSSF